MKPILLSAACLLAVAACRSTPELPPVESTLAIKDARILEAGPLLPSEGSAPRANRPAAPFPELNKNGSAQGLLFRNPAAAKTQPKGDALPLKGRLEAVQLADFVALMARPEILGFPYVLDPSLRGGNALGGPGGGATVTIDFGASTWDRDSARELLESVLRLHGAVIEAGPGNLQRIVPAAKSGRSETSPVELLSVPGYTAAEALDMLKSFLPEGTNISVLPRSGMLAVRDGSPALLAKARALAEALGRSGPAGWPGMVIPIHEALPSRLALELKQILPVLGLPVEGDGAVRLLALDRVGLLIITAATPAALEQVSAWSASLDSAAESGEDPILYRYPVRYGVSRDLILKTASFFPNAVINLDRSSDAVTAAAGAGGAAAAAGGAAAAPAAPPPVAPAGAADTAAPPSFQEAVSFVEDARQNQIILRLSPRAWRLTRPLLDSLDAPPLQCVIEVTVLDVQLNSDLKYGVSWALEQKFGGNPGNLGSGNSNESVSPPVFGPPGSVTPGLSAMLTKSGSSDEFALLQALDTDTKSELLFRPKLLTINGNPAEIKIGQRAPYRRGTNSTQTGVQDNIEYADVGVLLKVTPQISAARKVILTLDQEISGIAENTVDGINSPVFNKISLSTRLSVDDGEMILLGGMITKDDRSNSSGIPLLKDIPFIGWLFSGNTNITGRKELVIFLKVNVVESPPGPLAVAEEYHRAIELMNRKDPK